MEAFTQAVAAFQSWYPTSSRLFGIDNPVVLVGPKGPIEGPIYSFEVEPHTFEIVHVAFLSRFGNFLINILSGESYNSHALPPPSLFLRPHTNRVSILVLRPM